MYFTSGEEDIDPINIGLDNDYVITSDLTKNEDLWLRLALISDSGTKFEYTDKIKFILRQNMISAAATSEPLYEQLQALKESAFAMVEYSDSQLLFKNSGRTERGSVPISCTNGGGNTAPPPLTGTLGKTI